MFVVLRVRGDALIQRARWLLRKGINVQTYIYMHIYFSPYSAFSDIQSRTLRAQNINYSITTAIPEVNFIFFSFLARAGKLSISLCPESRQQEMIGEMQSAKCPL